MRLLDCRSLLLQEGELLLLEHRVERSELPRGSGWTTKSRHRWDVAPNDLGMTTYVVSCHTHLLIGQVVYSQSLPSASR